MLFLMYRKKNAACCRKNFVADKLADKITQQQHFTND